MYYTLKTQDIINTLQTSNTPLSDLRSLVIYSDITEHHMAYILSFCDQLTVDFLIHLKKTPYLYLTEICDSYVVDGVLYDITVTASSVYVAESDNQ